MATKVAGLRLWDETIDTAVSKDIVSFISRDELLVKLAQELGPNGFNDWFKETFNKPAPYIYTKGSMGRFKSKRFTINNDLLKGDEDE